MWKKEKPSKSHYDIIVLSVWFGSNYGSLLNGYAVYKLLKKKGYSVLMVSKINAKPDDPEINGTLSARFIDKFYPSEDISPLYTYKQLSILNQYGDTFLVGSDQIFDYYICGYFNNAFLLGFVDDDKRRISFGTSFGHAKDKTPPEKIASRKTLFQRFHALSVREASGIDICRDNYGVKARTVLEPVFCIERDEFYSLAETSSVQEREPYILTYILDPTEEKRGLIQYYRDYTGKKVINILDGQPHTFKENLKKMNLPNSLTGIDVEDFLNLYINADFIITDSFHGSAFSIIFNKPFLSIANKRRGYTRFEDLLGRFDLKDRMVYDSSLDKFDNKNKMLEPIDYSIVNKKISQYREDSIKWLDSALSTPIKSSSVILRNVKAQLDNKECTGCGACINSCPVEALSYETDEWGYYKSKIDYSTCINCGRCVSVCPAIKLPINNNTKIPSCYEFISSDEDLLRRSSSGGIFPTLARQVLSDGGVVAGAAWTDSFSVEHVIIEDEKNLQRLQKSKYLQSFMGNTFRRIQKYLESGRKVLFSGTPCQVTGLKAYLEKTYEDLITVDIFCSNAPSSYFFRKYLDDSFPEGITEYEFRYKKPEWNWDCITVKVTDKNDVESVRRGSAQDSFQRVFHNHTMCPYHCEKCKYQSVPRPGDLSIGDFWGIGKHDLTIEDKRGVSVVLCNNDKGKRLFDRISMNAASVKKEVPLNWIGGNGYAINGAHSYAPASRDLFYQVITKKPFAEAVNYALKPNRGMYRSIYNNTNSILQFDAIMLHFRFEPNIWEELTIDGRTTLIVKEGKWKENGHYARLSLAKALRKDKQYQLAVKYKIKTNSPLLNFHIIDSGSKNFQIIYSDRIAEKNKGDQWIELNKTFIPNADYYDEFMIGAAQVTGINNFLTIAYISIIEL